jgi:hypothetical protein
MLFGLDINHLLTFPVKDAQERRRFSIGALLILASTIIPILPYLPVLGYSMKIMRQVAAGQQPSMPDWDDWETLFKDGLKLLGVRLIYILPLLLVLMPIFLLVMFGPIFGAATESESMFVLTTFVIFPLSMLCLMPIFIFVGIFIPVAEVHVAIQNEFSAGFRIRECWAIFRANIGGFLLAYLFIYAISMLLSFALQILIFTVILLCLLPIIIPLISMYIVLFQYTLIAAAYREGTLKQSAPAATLQE